jgi:hypothetical protein
MLVDGRYDILIIDVVDADDADADDSGPGDAARPLTLELTIVAGELRGEVVRVRARGLGRSALDLIGLPGTLDVAGGAPTVTVDDA